MSNALSQKIFNDIFYGITSEKDAHNFLFSKAKTPLHKLFQKLDENLAAEALFCLYKQAINMNVETCAENSNLDIVSHSDVNNVLDDLTTITNSPQSSNIDCTTRISTPQFKESLVKEITKETSILCIGNSILKYVDTKKLIYNEVCSFHSYPGKDTTALIDIVKSYQKQHINTVILNTGLIDALNATSEKSKATEEFKLNVQSLIQEVQEKFTPKKLVLTEITPIVRKDKMSKNAYIYYFNNELNELAKNSQRIDIIKVFQHFLFDNSKDLINKRFLAFDGIHLSKQGLAVIVKQIKVHFHHYEKLQQGKQYSMHTRKKNYNRYLVKPNTSYRSMLLNPTVERSYTENTDAELKALVKRLIALL